MRRSGTLAYFAVFLALVAGIRCQGADNTSAAPSPDFQEVYGAIRTHLSGINESELNRAAVEGLVSELGDRVWLITNNAASGGTNSLSLVSASRVMEGNIAYLRVEKVADGLPKAVREAYAQLAATNKLKGVVLDLRYAGGHDYAAAAATADLFLKAEKALLDWGKGVERSKEKPDAISLPIAVLVNSRTSAAAEALAAILRTTGAGLVLGGHTAGRAMMAEELTLTNGDKLFVATGPIKLGDGTAMSKNGLKPDIAVEVNAEDERSYYVDAYKLTADLTSGAGLLSTNQSSSTNRAPRRIRFNEAELVRERREGLSEGDLTGSPAREPDKPVVADPVLARALDLLKGLALVRESRS